AGAQKPGQKCLLAAITPRLADDDRRDDDLSPLRQCPLMNQPHSLIFGVDRDQRSGVVDVGHVHAVRSVWARYSASAAAIMARTSALSAAVMGPCSASTRPPTRPQGRGQAAAATRAQARC